MKTLFTCEHCGKDVHPAEYRGEPKPRNHCPYCLWSKHTEIGKPCGAMMRGADMGDDQITWRCLGCGYMMRAYSDDAMLRQLCDSEAFRFSLRTDIGGHKRMVTAEHARRAGRL